MKHIIHKLLLIGNIDLIEDIVTIIKENYIMCSATIISPPTTEEWIKYKTMDIYGNESFTDKNGFTFMQNNKLPCNKHGTRFYLHYLSIELRGVAYITGDFRIYLCFNNIDIKNLWFNKTLFDEYYDCDYLISLYFFPNF